MTDICDTAEPHSHICVPIPQNFGVESDDVARLIRNASKDLKRLDAAIATLEKRRSIQQAYLQQLLRNGLSTKDLPPEVLSLVLHFAVGGDPPLPSTLPLVCRTWARVFRTTPEIWSNLPSLPSTARKLREGDFLRVYSLYIERAGSRPLKFAIRGPPSERIQQFIEKRLLPLVRSNANRISAMELDTGLEVVRALTTSIPSPFLSIRTLHLEVAPPRGSAQPMRTFNDIIPLELLPNLTRFSSLSVTGRNQTMWGSWSHPHLSELELAMDKVEDLFSALADCPNVVTVFLCGNWTLGQRDHPSTRIHFSSLPTLILRRLKSLKLSGLSTFAAEILCSKLAAPGLESLSLDELTTAIANSPLVSQSRRLAQLELGDSPSGLPSSRSLENSLISINCLNTLCLSWVSSIHSFLRSLSIPSDQPPLPHLQKLTLTEGPILRTRNTKQLDDLYVDPKNLNDLRSSSYLEDIASLVAARSGPLRTLVNAESLDKIWIHFRSDDCGCSPPSETLALWTAMELGTRAEIKAFNRFRKKLFSEMRVVKHLPNVINEEDTQRWENFERGYRDIPGKWMVIFDATRDALSFGIGGVPTAVEGAAMMEADKRYPAGRAIEDRMSTRWAAAQKCHATDLGWVRLMSKSDPQHCVCEQPGYHCVGLSFRKRSGLLDVHLR